MTGIYILIMFYSTTNGVAMHSVEFATREACITAKTVVQAEMTRPAIIGGGTAIRAVCVSKS